jgi:hypothetical protein
VWGHDVVIERTGLSPVVLMLGPDGCRLRGESPAHARITTPTGDVVDVAVEPEPGP